MRKSLDRIRSVRFHVIVGILVCVITLTAIWSVHAQDLKITPWPSWDYGNVLVGTSAIVTFDLESLGPSEVWIYYTFLNETPDDDPSFASPFFGEYTLGAFSFDPLTYPIFPRASPTGEHDFVDVIFAPPSPGHYSVYLGIESNDSAPPPGLQAFLLLEGNAVEATVPEPATMLLLGSGLLGLWGARKKYKK